MALSHRGHGDSCAERSLASGYWQLARIYAAGRRVAEAIRYAGRCLDYSRGLGPCYLGYAYEALARAELIAGHGERAAVCLAEARRQADLMGECEERARLLADLATIGG